MEIQPRLNSSPLEKTPPNKPVTAKAETPVEQASFGKTAALENALRSTPNSRPEEVARAKELINQPQYPPPETLDKLAGLLAGKLMDKEI